ncbi:inorganic pyrophosphatase [Apiospora arundinis]
MYIPLPPTDRAGSTAAGPSRLHLMGHRVAVDTRRTQYPQAVTRISNYFSHIWGWAASHITNRINSASKDNKSHTFVSSLRKRTTSQDLDVTIGVVVGVLVGVFVLGTLAFCIMYRNSIRFKRKKKFRSHHRHKSGGSRGSRGSKSSKSSQSSASSASSAGGDGGGGGGGGGDAEAAAPAPAEGG